VSWFGEAATGLRRSPLLGSLAIASIGFSLFIVGLFALTSYNIHQALTTAESRVEVVAYLDDDAGTERIQLAQREIGSFPEVDSVRFVSKTEALVNASNQLTEFSDVFTDLDVNPLPASLEIHLLPGQRTPEAVAAVADRVALYPFVEDVRYGLDWVNRLHALRRVAGGAAIVLGGAFALVAVLLIGTAVRMWVLARAREIDIMYTVGASEAYIRRPYLVEGLLTGLLGGVFALGLTIAVYLLVSRVLFEIEWIPDMWVLAGIAAGGLIGCLAAARAIRRELRAIHAV
jgi:cell division transport system permease protein